MLISSGATVSTEAQLTHLCDRLCPFEGSLTRLLKHIHKLRPRDRPAEDAEEIGEGNRNGDAEGASEGDADDLDNTAGSASDNESTEDPDLAVALALAAVDLAPPHVQERPLPQDQQDAASTSSSSSGTSSSSSSSPQVQPDAEPIPVGSASAEEPQVRPRARGVRAQRHRGVGADLVVAKDGRTYGHIKLNISLGNMFATCSLHGNSCVRTQTNKRGRKSGRPLGFLVSWLLQQSSYASKQEHMQCFPCHADRRSARDLAKELPFSEEFLEQEASQQGSDSEPP